MKKVLNFLTKQQCNMLLMKTNKKIYKLGIGFLISTIAMILIFLVLKLNAKGESIEFTAFIYWILIHYFVLSFGVIMLVLRMFRTIVQTSGWYYMITGILNFMFGASYPVILWIHQLRSHGNDSITFIVNFVVGIVIILDIFLDKRSA